MAAPLVTTMYPQSRQLACSDVFLSREDEDSDMEVVNPRQVLLTAQEDPIVTHDSLVARMTAAGVQWIPPDQKTKKMARVRWSTPQVDRDSMAFVSSVRTNANGSPPATSTATSSLASDETFKEPDPTGIRVTTSKPKSNAQLNGVPSSTPSSTGATPVAGAETKLRDLETQLQQEQAIRRQQNDYIRQLQKYYDNLLAKHALAEVTIDQLRFVSKVGNSSENDPISRRSGSRSTLSDAILTGSDALHPRPLDNYFKTPTASDSVRRQQHVKSSSVSLLSPCSFPVAPSHVQAGLRRSGLRIDSESLDAAARQDISPRKFMLAPRRPQLLSASTDQLLCQQHLSSEDKRPGRSTDLHFTSANGTASGFESSAGEVPNAQWDTSSSRRRDATTSQPSTPDSEAANAGAASLLSQLRFALALIDEKLTDFEWQPQPCGADRRHLLDVLTEELEELQKTYRSAQFLWASGSGFDNDRQVQNQMCSLASRLSATAAAAATAENAVNRRLSFDSSSPECGIGTTGAKERPSDLSSTHESQPASSDSAVYSQHNSSTSPELNDTSQSRLDIPNAREAAELHFIRLMSRYNEVKTRAWDATIMKELESLMQRLLQLSDRYSIQSSVISSPKDLRAMFQLDQESNRLSKQLGNTRSGERTVFVNKNHIVFDRTSTAADTSLSNKVRLAKNTKATATALTPDSGLPTPPASCLSQTEFFGSPTLSPGVKAQHQRQASVGRRLPPDAFWNVRTTASGARLSDGDICPTDSGVGATSDTGYRSRPSSARLRNGDVTNFHEFNSLRSRPTDTDKGITSCSELQALSDSHRTSQPDASEDGLRYGSGSLHYRSKSTTEQTAHGRDLRATASLHRSPSHDMLIRDTISLEEDIRRLRQSVARLNGLNSVTSLDSTGLLCSARSSASKNSGSDTASPRPTCDSGSEPWHKKGVPASNRQMYSTSKFASQPSAYQHPLKNLKLRAPSNSSSEDEPRRRQTVKILPRRLRPISSPDFSDNEMAGMQVVGVGILPRPYDSSSLPNGSGCVLRSYQKNASASSRKCRPSRRDHSVDGVISTSRLGSVATANFRCSVLPLGREKPSRNPPTCKESAGLLADPPWGGSMPSLAATVPKRSFCGLGAPRTAGPTSTRKYNDVRRSQSSFRCRDDGARSAASDIADGCGALPCNSCGGSGYLRYCANCEADQPAPAASTSQCIEHSKSQPCMPVMMSSVRLPVRHYETWTERVYDVQEFDVTPQPLPPLCKPDCPINKPRGACRLVNRCCRLSHQPTCLETSSLRPLRMTASHSHPDSALRTHNFSSTSSPSHDSDNSQQPIMLPTSRIQVKSCLEPGTCSHSAFGTAKSDTRMAHRLQTGLSAVPTTVAAATRKKCFCDLE
uniref:Uncharacterized protein n=1 Tax=Schistocephalus solidus TaxID=70667 RepID=A0A0V0J4V0_SCHSO